MELCKFCMRAVVDDTGSRTEEFGLEKHGKYVCARCMKAFEFSLGN